jgi:hypothetical protein
MLFLQMSAANYPANVGWARPTGRANMRPMINSASPPIWWARREERAFAPLHFLPIPSFATQRRQSDSGGVEAAIDGENLSGDVA